MEAAVEAAELRRTIVSNPAVVAIALLGFEVKDAMGRTIRKALACFFVKSTAVAAFPAFFADASAIDAETVIRAGGIWAVD